MPETTSALPPPNEVPIHWELIGMDQDNATLIEAIRKKVVWYPPSASNSRKNTYVVFRVTYSPLLADKVPCPKPGFLS